MNNARIYTKW